MRKVVGLGRVAVAWTAAAAASAWAQPGSQNVAVDADDIGGVVTGPNGPEAGVWVIAETDELPTKFRKIVVTDEQGRYLLPDLPAANYVLWVRGYGLVDSPRVRSAPGRVVALPAVIAPDARAAAQVYPANYWYSLIELPSVEQFPGTGANGNGIEAGVLTQHHWINTIKTGCNVCHQLGNLATREFPPGLGTFESSYDAWDHRTQVGQDGTAMISAINGLGRRPALTMYADWTDRIAAGEVPPMPPRPQGIERNLVLTLWEWGGPATFAHDELSTDKRNPRANANGPIYAVDWGNDGFLTLDPNTHTATEVRIPVVDPTTPPGKPQVDAAAIAVLGQRAVLVRPCDHESRGDGQQRARLDVVAISPARESAGLLPQPSIRGARAARVELSAGAVLRPEDEVVPSGQHLLRHAPRAVRVRCRRDALRQRRVQRRDRLDQHANPRRDRRRGGRAGLVPAVLRHRRQRQDRSRRRPLRVRAPRAAERPARRHADSGRRHLQRDRASDRRHRLGRRARADAGAHHPHRSEDLRLRGLRAAVQQSRGQRQRLHAARHRRRYLRRDLDGARRQRPSRELRSPQVQGLDRARRDDGVSTVPEGWTLYRTPGPSFKGATDAIPVDMHYYNFVDKFNTLGLGPNVPLANGTNSDSLLALLPDGRWVVLRVPYPLGFFSRGMDGRIDDPNGGWKGRALYADYGQNAVWHIEGGKGTRSSLIKFQLRPDPLAK